MYSLQLLVLSLMILAVILKMPTNASIFRRTRIGCSKLGRVYQENGKLFLYCSAQKGKDVTHTADIPCDQKTFPFLNNIVRK